MFGFGKGYTQDPIAAGRARTPSEKLMLLGAMLQDFGSGGEKGTVLALQNHFATTEKARQKAAAQAQLAQLLTGGAGASAGAAGSIPTLRQALPSLLAAQGAGVDIGDYVSLLDKVGPQVRVDSESGETYDERDAAVLGKRFGRKEYINNFLVDPYAANAPGYLPKLSDNTMPDGQGGVMPIRGAAEAAARERGMIAGAEAGARAPYDFISIPTPSGAPGVTSKSNAMGRTFIGQSPAERVRAESLAAGDADRANALQARASQAASQLATLDNMERLLPDVISGFGAETRLKAARALAFAGNEGAARQVTATETYLNEARNLVSDIIKSFGANPTEGERKYAERMSGADANLNPETLKEGIRLRRERINRDLANAGRPAPATQGQARPVPKAGEVVGGYRFKGGDPRNPQSWQKVN